MEATKKLFPPDGFRFTDYAVALLSLGLNPKFCITKLQKDNINFDAQVVDFVTL